MTDTHDERPVPEFFENDQEIGLIALIDTPHGNIKAELADKVDLSGKVLKDLIDEAIDTGLIEETQIRADDHPRSDRYQLTPHGTEIQSLLQEKGLDEVQRDYLDRKSKLESVVPDVKQTIEAEDLHKTPSQEDSGDPSDETDDEYDPITRPMLDKTPLVFQDDSPLGEDLDFSLDEEDTDDKE